MVTAFFSCKAYAIAKKACSPNAMLKLMQKCCIPVSSRQQGISAG